jgi:hypothetical protein
MEVNIPVFGPFPGLPVTYFNPAGIALIAFLYFHLPDLKLQVEILF